jgi:intracellular multiplication protein IcmE
MSRPIVAYLISHDASMGQYIDYGYDVSFLKEWGFTYIDFSNAGYSPLYLKDNSFSYIDFSNLGYTPQMLESAGFEYYDFSNVGYTPQMLKSAGFKYYDFSNAEYTPQMLESAGFLYADFSNVGYTPQILASNGFKYYDFSNIGYTPQMLESAGFLYADFSNVGYTPVMLESAGFTIKDTTHSITSDFSNISIITVPYLLSIGANYYWYEIFNYTPFELLYPPNNFKYTDFLNAGYTPQILKSSGFKLRDFSNAGYSPQILETSGFKLIDFSNVGYSPRYLKNAGFKLIDFSNAGYSPQILESDDFDYIDLSNIGFYIKELLDWNFKCTNFLKCGYNARDLFNYGFLKRDFSNNGWEVWNLMDASFIKTDYQITGYSIPDLQRQSGWKIDSSGIVVKGFNTKSVYSNVGYSVKDLYLGNIKKYSNEEPQYGFEELGYSVQDIIDAGLTTQLQQLGYDISDVSNIGFTKKKYDLVGFSVYDLLDYFPVNQVISLGYSSQVTNAYKNFIYKVSTSKWNSFSSKKYPINNIYSFQDISFNSIDDNSGNTTITISWSSFINYTTNDGLSLNPYTFCFYNEPTLVIKQFGGIPLSRNSAINTNFFQFIDFKGKIEAIDSPRFLPDTSLYNAFSGSTSSIFQRIPSWQTFQITDLRNLFFNVSYFKERIGNWNFSHIKGKYMENIISGTGYNPIQTSIFLQDLSSNLTMNSDISLGHIPKYYINNKTNIAMNSLISRNILFDGSGSIANVNSFKTKYTTFGYTTIEDLLVDARTAGYSAIDLSGYSLSQLHYAEYTIKELNTIKLNNNNSKYTIYDYYNNGFKLIDFIDSSYNAIDLSGLKTEIGFKAIDYGKIHYLRSDISAVFQVTELLSSNYTLANLKYIGYSVKEIALNIEYSVYDYTTVNYSLIDISGAVTSRNISYNYSYIYNKILTDNSANLFKSKNISSLDLKEFGFTISQIITMGYTLTDLYDASYTIRQIPDYITRYADVNYTYAGYTLTDISNAGFVLSEFTRYSAELPQILMNNKINVSDWKNINYTISQIYLFNYPLSEIRNNYTLSEIIHSNCFNVSQLKTIGFNASDLLALG